MAFDSYKDYKLHTGRDFALCKPHSTKQQASKYWINEVANT